MMHQTTIAGKTCYVYEEQEMEFVLIQPVDEHDRELLEREVEQIRSLSRARFSLFAYQINAWNDELSPWPASPVFGKECFGRGAADTLAYLTDQLLPVVTNGNSTRVILGGYSLAGLFSLWANYQTARFSGIAAASPSVWFPGWREYVQTRKPQSQFLYLSLGDKEERSRNPVMSTVGANIRDYADSLEKAGICSVLEWNQGNHFVDSEIRTAKGFAWVMNRIQEEA